MSHPVDILETPEGLSVEEAKQLEDIWLARTGRRCVILSGGRYAGTIMVEDESDVSMSLSKGHGDE